MAKFCATSKVGRLLQNESWDCKRQKESQGLHTAERMLAHLLLLACHFWSWLRQQNLIKEIQAPGLHEEERDRHSVVIDRIPSQMLQFLFSFSFTGCAVGIRSIERGVCQRSRESTFFLNGDFQHSSLQRPWALKIETDTLKHSLFESGDKTNGGHGGVSQKSLQFLVRRYKLYTLKKIRYLSLVLTAWHRWVSQHFQVTWVWSVPHWDVNYPETSENDGKVELSMNKRKCWVKNWPTLSHSWTREIRVLQSVQNPWKLFLTSPSGREVQSLNVWFGNGVFPLLLRCLMSGFSTLDVKELLKFRKTVQNRDWFQ